jgi:hypothetical protein
LPTVTGLPAETAVDAVRREGRWQLRPRHVAICGLALAALGIASWIAFHSGHDRPRTPQIAAQAPIEATTAALATGDPSAVPSTVVPPAAAPAGRVPVTPEPSGKGLELIAIGQDAARRGEIQKVIGSYTEAARNDATSVPALLARARLYSDYRVMNWPGVIADATEVSRL